MMKSFCLCACALCFLMSVLADVAGEQAAAYFERHFFKAMIFFGLVASAL
jgi:hypothetical protein